MRWSGMRGWRWIAGSLAGLIVPLSVVGAAEPEGVAFFEQKIRPVLVKECYSCHSAGAKKLKGGLRLDTRAGVLAGGDSGPAVVPGKPDESLILEALRHDGLAMPPKGKLPEPVIADFARWVSLGAPDPRVETGPAAAPARAGIDLSAGREFWAYRPPARHEPPAVKDGGWPRDDIDRFIRAAQEARGIDPVAEADRTTLARRLYSDLIGLPPTPEETDAFVADTSATAYEALVDRLLASPHFGERWGRHWLDVARFGESLTLRGLVFKQAWRYRDYVIDAFNADVPFDRFIREQVAGDLLPAADLAARRRQMIATSFLTLGNTNLEEQDKNQLVMDVVDEQIDTIGKAFLAQTVGCARCHDHKFDPIPTADYYALAGILRNVKTLEHANVSKWLEKPLPSPAEEETALKRHEAELAAVEARLKRERNLAASRGKPLALRRGPVAAADLPGIVVDDSQAKQVGRWKQSRTVASYIGEGYLYDLCSDKGDKTLTFQPEFPEAGKYDVWLAYTPHANRSPAVPVTILSADGEKTVEINMRSEPPLEGRFVSLGQYRFERNGQGYVLISNEGPSGCVSADAVVFVPLDQPAAAAPKAAGKTARNDAIRTLEARVKQLRAEGPNRDLVMTVEELPEIADTRIHVRGSVHTLGDPVHRGFLQVATCGPVPTLPDDQSGRRELAEWLSGRSNPLAARVIVNRVWHWLFGAGLVRTTDNFGTTGERPSHPELLDDLAVRFMDEGWSIKALIRRIVLSRSYRLAAVEDAKARRLDPENRLLWRSNRRRLDAECIRDAILSASGRLDRTMGGASFPDSLAADYGFHADTLRRSIYVPVFRNALPELLEVFDFADPSMVVGRRNVSTVAPQALFLLNHPFLVEAARQAARLLLAEPGLDDAGRVDRAYRIALGRTATDSERRIALGFVHENPPEAGEDAWALVFQALFASADFRYVD